MLFAPGASVTGIVAVAGEFGRGEIVDITDTKERRIARGKTNYDAVELSRIKGLKSSQIERVLGEKPFDEVIHRDNLVLLSE